MKKCYSCPNNAKYSILLFEYNENNYLYIPNQFSRSNKLLPKPKEIWFCIKCMREIEDNFQKTVSRLQSESLPTKREADCYPHAANCATNISSANFCNCGALD